MISLEKYKGKATRFTCPGCNQKQEFTRYKDDEGNYLHESVGKCNRENNCGYHYTPKQFYADNTELREEAKENFLARNGFSKKRRKFISQSKTRVKIIPSPKTDFIDQSILESTLTDYEQNGFVQFLLQLFPNDTKAVIESITKYCIGTWQPKRTIFWEIDKNLKIRTGKLIAYDAITGKRIKEIKPSYTHAELKQSGKISNDFQLKQCLFGEHLLIEERVKTVAIVEAEKTAIIASIIFPEMIWLAAGAKSYLNVEKLEKVGARNIILFPDADAFDAWSQVADEAQKQGINVKVSTLIETNGTGVEKEGGYDIADYLIEQQRRKTKLKAEDYLIEIVPANVLNDEKLCAEFETILEERLAYLEFVEELSSEEAKRVALKPESIQRILNSVLLE